LVLPFPRGLCKMGKYWALKGENKVLSSGDPPEGPFITPQRGGLILPVEKPFPSLGGIEALKRVILDRMGPQKIWFPLKIWGMYEGAIFGGKITSIGKRSLELENPIYQPQKAWKLQGIPRKLGSRQKP